jgi:pimeloyl-ACP methyl ester carboxylesterase
VSTTPPLPTLFCLHALGVSGTEFAPLAERLRGAFEVVALDLPGFGDNSAASGTGVAEMVAFATRRVRTHGSPRWMLVGHSMGAKIASIVASRALSGEAPVFGLQGVVVLAGSPPSPEPMPERKRAEMIGWAVDRALAATSARQFIDANVGAPLDPEHDATVMADLQRASPEAWRAWLQRGSLEDWSAEVGELRMPALVVSGGADGDLGEAAQRELNGAVYPLARFETLEGAGHLLPLERPDEIADLVRGFWHDTAGRAPIMPADHSAVIASPRMSARTRGILARRALPDDPTATPRVLSPAQLSTLRAVADRVVPQDAAHMEGELQDGMSHGGVPRDGVPRDVAPQHGGPQTPEPQTPEPAAGAPIDLALRLDAQLAAGTGDGWRNASLPDDVEAYRAALDGLAGFASLSPSDQDARLAAIADGTAGQVGALAPAQLTAWFEDACSDLVRLWLAHPASLARIGFDGYANGGDGIRPQGFELLGAGEREAWEPMPPEHPTEQRATTTTPEPHA